MSTLAAGKPRTGDVADRRPPVTGSDRPTPPLRPGEPLVAHLDEQRGTFAMWLFILSEALLFGCLLFAYYYLAGGAELRWLVEEPPSLKFVIPMLIILLASSMLLHLGEKQIHRHRYGWGRAAIAGTLLLAAVFIVLSYFDYRHHLKHLLPTSNAYGSIQYTITSLHLAHLILGMLMLIYVVILPRLEPNQRIPHRPYHNASMYWHFVDTVWIFIVGLLYIVPNLRL